MSDLHLELARLWWPDSWGAVLEAARCRRSARKERPGYAAELAQQRARYAADPELRARKLRQKRESRARRTTQDS